MPPKFKVSREEIINAALIITEQYGLSAVTARDLGKILGLSSRPLYSYFGTIDELKEEVIIRVFEHYKKIISSGDNSNNYFLSVGINYIEFAKNNREFYKIIHSSLNDKARSEIQSFEYSIIETIREREFSNEYTHDEIKDLYIKMAIFTHGLADLMFQGEFKNFDRKDTEKILSETGEAIISNFKRSKEART